MLGRLQTLNSIARYRVQGKRALGGSVLFCDGANDATARHYEKLLKLQL